MSRINSSNQIVKVLGESCNPKSALEILSEIIKTSPTTNKTTVYRALSKLEKEGKVRSFSLTDGVVRYENSSHEHGHFVCEECGVVSTVDLPKKISNQKVNKVVYTEFGICNDCEVHTIV
jgi:Fur family transcriptional regulator, peroxide stress response regulator